jgi:hypothetical protein
MDKYLKNWLYLYNQMFRRLINNNIKTIGIRKFYNDNNNHRIIQELKQINDSLRAIAIFLCGLNIILAIKR